MLLNVLEVVAPFKHFTKLREFIKMKLPPGFPVKVGKLEFRNKVKLKMKELVPFLEQLLTRVVQFQTFLSCRR